MTSVVGFLLAFGPGSYNLSANASLRRELPRISSSLLQPKAEEMCSKRTPLSFYPRPLYGSALKMAGRCSMAMKSNAETLSVTLTNEALQLPKTILPVHYDLKICPQVEEPFNFSGSVQIELLAKKETSRILLNLADLNVTSVKLWQSIPEEKTNEKSTKRKPPKRKNDKFMNFSEYQGKNYTTVSPIKEHLIIKENVKRKYLTLTGVIIHYNLERLEINLKENLKVNDTYKLQISFSGIASESSNGIFKMHHFDKNGIKRYSLATQFQIAGARRAFPCFDEPAFRSTFSLSLCRETTSQAISNMPKLSTIPRKGYPGMVWDAFRKSVPMSTYIVAFVVLNNFDHLDCDHSSLPFKVWLPSELIRYAEFSCEVGPALLDLFERKFNVSISVPKMDLVGLTNFQYIGMENWGLMTFMQEYLVVDKNSLQLANMERNCLSLISHELAHQWFGNLVTPKWWSDLWLSEGLATFYAMYGVHHVRPSWDEDKSHFLSAQIPILYYDSKVPFRPLVRYPETINLDMVFHAAMYDKGSALLRMISHFMTEPVFHKGVKDYLFNMQFSTVTQDDLWFFLEKAGSEIPLPAKIADIMDAWTKQGGYPVITVVGRENGTLILTQQRHKLESEEDTETTKNNPINSLNDPKWWIPISVVTQHNPNMSNTFPKFWMNYYRQIFLLDDPPAPNDWYLLNVRQTGFFRVNYDVENWLLLIQQLRDNHRVFDDFTRVQLIDDCFVMAHAEKLSFTIPFEMVMYLDREHSPHPMYCALHHLNNMEYLKIKELQEIILPLLVVHYPSTGLLVQPTEIPYVRDTNVLLIKMICKFYFPCIEEAIKLYNAPEDYPQGSIEEELHETVISIGIHQAGEIGWKKVYKSFLSEKDPKKKDHLLGALITSKYHALNKKILLELENEDIDTPSSKYLTTSLEKMASDSSTTELAWEFLQQKWPRVVGSSKEEEYFKAVVPYLHTEEQYHQLQEFLSSSMAVSSMPKSEIEGIAKQVLKRVEMENRMNHEIQEWLVRTRTA